MNPLGSGELWKFLVTSSDTSIFHLRQLARLTVVN